MGPALMRVAAVGVALMGAACDSPSSGSSDAAVATDTGTSESDAADSTTAPDTTTEPPGEARVVTLVEDREVQMVLGGSQPVSFEVPPDTLSVTVTVLGDAKGSFALDSWVTLSGNELVYPGWLRTDSGAGSLCLECTNRISVSQGAFAAIAPNNPSAILEAGPQEITLGGFTPAEVRQDVNPGCGDDICHFFDQFQCANDCAPTTFTGTVRVWVHAKVQNTPGAGLPETGELALNLHFTGAQGLTAATAPTDSEFQANLESMRQIYATVGIAIGEVTYRDIDPSFRVIESIDGPDSDLQLLYEQSAGNTVDGVDLYFVDEISSASLGGFGLILGIAGGIPGPPLVHGTHRSGVAIAIKPVQGVPAGVDTTMAHETGHFLGLFHTSEQSFGGGQQIHDPLPDTPQNDESYLMFNTGAGNKVSPWQGQVMRSNPWVRHPVEK